MRPVSVLLTGVPHFVTLHDLSYSLDLIFDTDEIGTFKTRDLTHLTTNGRRLIALDFSSGYDAIVAQDRLHGYRYALSNGNEYTLCAKITKRIEFTVDASPSWEIITKEVIEQSSSSVVDNRKLADLVPAVTGGDMVRAHATLDAQLELLKKQKLLLQAEREVLRERKKLKREYSSKALDSDDEPSTSRRRRRSLTRDICRSPDTMSREHQLLRSPRTLSGSPHKVKLLELRARSRSTEESTTTFQKKSEGTRNSKETLKYKDSTTPKAKKSSKQRSRSRNRRSRSKNRLRQLRSRSKHSRSRSREVQKRRRTRDRSWSRECCLPKCGTRTARTLRSPDRWRWSRSRERLCRLPRDREGRRRSPPAGSPSRESCSRQLAIMDNYSRSLEAETIIVERNFAMDPPVIDYSKIVTFTNNFEQKYSLNVINSFDVGNCKTTDIDDKYPKNAEADKTITVNIDGMPMKETDGDQNDKQDLRNEDIKKNNNVLNGLINLVEELDTPDALYGTTKDEKHNYESNLLIDVKNTFGGKLSPIVDDRVINEHNNSHVCWKRDSFLVKQNTENITKEIPNTSCFDPAGSNVGKDASTALVTDTYNTTSTTCINGAPETAALDSGDEPSTSRRRRRSLTRDICRSPDTMSREHQLLRSPRTLSGSPHKVKLLELRARSRSTEESTPTFQKKSEGTRNLKETLKYKDSTTPKAKKSSKQRSRSRNRRSRSKNRLRQLRSRSKHSRSRSREVQKRRRTRDRSWSRECCLPKCGTRTARTLRSPDREGKRPSLPAGSPSRESCSRQRATMDNCSRSLEAETIIVERNFAVDPPVIDYSKDVTFTNNFEQKYSLNVINSFDVDNCKTTDIDDKYPKTDADMTITVNIDVMPMKETDGEKNNNVLNGLINLVEELDTPYALYGTTKDEKHNYESNLLIDVKNTFGGKLSPIVDDRVINEHNTSHVCWKRDSLLAKQKTENTTKEIPNTSCFDPAGSNIGKDAPTVLVTDTNNNTSATWISESPETAVTEIIEIIDKTAPPLPRPKFVVIIKKLMKEMQSSISKLKHVKMSFQCKFKYVLRVLLREIVAGKDRMHRTQILESFREKYPKEQDDEFLERIVRNMNAGKYGDLGWTDDKETSECHDGDDVVLIEKQYDTITVFDSDDEPEPIEKEIKVLEQINGGRNSTTPTAFQIDTLESKRQRGIQDWKAWALVRGLTPTSTPRVPAPTVLAPRVLAPTVIPGAVAIPPKKAHSSRLGKVKAANDGYDITAEPTSEANSSSDAVTKLNKTDLDDIQDISGPAKVSAMNTATIVKSKTASNADNNAEVQHNNSVDKTNNTERINSTATADEVETKVKLESNDIVPEFTDAELENMLSGIANVHRNSADRIEENEPPKVTAITIMTSYSELCSLKYGGNGTRKEDGIKHECVESIEEYEGKSELNTADEATINSLINKDDDEESLESISKYVESICMCNEEHL